MNNFKLPSRLEQQYSLSILKLLGRILSKRNLSLQELINELGELTAEERFQLFARKIASNLMLNLYKHNRDNWLSKAKRTKKSREIALALQKEMNGPVGQMVNSLIDRNAFYITSAPLDISRSIVKKALKMQQNGMRASEVAKRIKKLAPDIAKSRIDMIARTEVSKSSTALTRAQSYEVGIEWYLWKTSEDGRVRSSHRHMQDVLIRWTDPPSPEALIGIKSTLGKYNSGESPNCRCYPEPLIDVDYISWPHKVYTNGRIVRMTKSKFKEIM